MSMAISGWLTFDGDDLPAAMLLMAVGMSVVFAALVLLLLAITVIDRISGEAAEANDAQALSAPSASATGGLSPQLLAVLTAAATAAMQRPVRVTHAHTQSHDPADDRTARHVDSPSPPTKERGASQSS